MAKFFFYWLPRILAICFIGFISIFALDVFQERGTPLQIAIALFMHLIPSFVLIVVLIATWRWEWIGSLIFGAAGMLYLYSVWISRSIVPHHDFEGRILVSLMIAGPALLLALLFQVGWLKRHTLRQRK